MKTILKNKKDNSKWVVREKSFESNTDGGSTWFLLHNQITNELKMLTLGKIVMDYEGVSQIE